MSEDTKKILELLASGKVTVDEADRLLRAIGAAPAAAKGEAKGEAKDEAPSQAEKPPARYLRIAVQKGANECGPGKQVNIRVPISLVKGGMRLGAMIPGYGDAINEQLRRHGTELDDHARRHKPVVGEDAIDQHGAIRAVGAIGTRGTGSVGGAFDVCWGPVVEAIELVPFCANGDGNPTAGPRFTKCSSCLMRGPDNGRARLAQVGGVEAAGQAID